MGGLEEFIPQEKRGTTCAGHFSAWLANAEKKMDENGRGKEVWSKLAPYFLSVAVIVM